MKKQALLIVPLGISILTLPGCAGYTAKPLRNLIPIVALRDAAVSKKENILFSYKLFDTEDCQKYLGRDVVKAGYQPIQITIINKTNKDLLFSPYNLSVPCVSPEEVMEKVYTSTAGRAIGYYIFGLFLPAIIDSAWSVEANNQLSKDYTTKATSEQIIRPGGTINGIVFTTDEASLDDFSVTLLDAQTYEPFVLTSQETSSFFIGE